MLPDSQDYNVSRPSLSLGIIILGCFMAPLLVHSLPWPSRLSPTTWHWMPVPSAGLPWLWSLATLVLCYRLARLGDRFGRKRLFMLGLLLAALASLLGALAQNSLGLMLCRFLQGMGNAIIFGNGLALINGITPIERRGRVTGIYAAFCYLGIVSGPLMGGYVIEHFSWRMVFFLPAPVLLLAALVGTVGLKWERFGKA